MDPALLAVYPTVQAKNVAMMVAGEAAGPALLARIAGRGDVAVV